MKDRAININVPLREISSPLVYTSKHPGEEVAQSVTAALAGTLIPVEVMSSGEHTRIAVGDKYSSHWEVIVFNRSRVEPKFTLIWYDSNGYSTPMGSVNTVGLVLAVVAGRVTFNS